MRIGVIFPQTEIGGDPGPIRTYVTAVERYGYSHILAYDHVIGADPGVHTGWAGPYDIDSTFHEPMVLFGFLAAFTSLELVSGIVILPQRPTALVAKQAAEVDLLCQGRFRLGVGLGWNRVEYEALGQDFTTRGARMEEQVPLLRRLWTERSVTHDGRFDHFSGVGIAPRPVQQPIPLWFGASSPPAFKRVGRLADGWFPMMAAGPKFEAAQAMVAESAQAAGRDPSAIGVEARVKWGSGGLSEATESIETWRQIGVTHLTVTTMGAGFTSVHQHLEVLEAVAKEIFT